MLTTAGHASGDFGRLIRGGHRAPVHAPPGRLVGLEHEFVVRSANGTVDFRELIGSLSLGGRRLDPGDRRAQRLFDGSVITADGREAEIALPPISRRPGFPDRLDREAQAARAHLAAALPEGHRLAGYSTHLSVSMPGDLALPAARLFAHTFAPGLILLADRADSPGLLVRPRPGRLELAFEYATGQWLRAAAAYVVGAGMAIARVLRGSAAADTLPPALQARSVITADRWGWGIAADAYGDHLLRRGRTSRLALADGGEIEAQEQLERAWAVARQALVPHAAMADLEAADALVAGGSGLPIELGDLPPELDRAPVVESRSPFGDLLVPRHRPGFRVEARFATWDTTVFSVESPQRAGYATVPRPYLGTFLRKLDGGVLDGPITAFLAAPPTGSRPRTWAEATEPALFDSIGTGAQIVAPEIGGLSIAGDRVGKVPVAPPPAVSVIPQPRFQFPPVFIGVGVIAVVIAIIGVFVLGGNGQPVAVTGTPTPGATILQGTPGGATPPGETPAILDTPTPPPPTVNIATAGQDCQKLTSWVATETVTNTFTPPGQTKPVSFTQEITATYVNRGNPAERIDQTTNNVTFTEYVIHNTLWRKVNSTLQKQELQAAQADGIRAQFDPCGYLLRLNIAFPVPAIPQVGAEEKNGVQAMHFHADETTPPPSGAKPLTKGAVIDVWIALDGNHVVAVEYANVVIGTATQSAKIEVTQVNDPNLSVRPS